MTIRGPPEVSQYVELSPTTGRNNGIFSLKINSSNLLDYEDMLKRNVTFEVFKVSNLIRQKCNVKLNSGCSDRSIWQSS